MKSGKLLAGKELVDAVVEQARNKLAAHITILDLRKLPGSADWFIICQGDNTTHTRAIADGVTDSLSAQGTHPWHMEGEDESRWILVDYSDVVFHVMLPDVREYFDLEQLWSEGERVDLEDSRPDSD